MQVTKNILLAAVPLGNTNSSFTYDKLVAILNYLVMNALLLGDAIATLAIVFYGFRMATSRGDAAKFTAAKNAFLIALVGGLLLFGAYTIIYTIRGAADFITK